MVTMSEWISIKERLPDKCEPFLAFTTGRVEMMQWKQWIEKGVDIGWWAFYTPCSCCSGHCSDYFTHWMPLPKPPKLE
jgi:hypothetical protein